MSYGAFEEHTWQHRKRAAWCAFSRLKPWFHRHGLTRRNRFYLWHTCIFSVLTYGLLATNVTAHILQAFQATVFHMLRLVLGDHAYRTHHTHQEVLRLHSIPEPLHLLCRVVDTALQRLDSRSTLISSDDILRQVPWDHLFEMRQLVRCVASTNVEVNIAASPSAEVFVQAPICCPFCPLPVHTVANLRRHCVVVHKVSQYRTTPHNVLDWAHQGLPQCNHCFQFFTTWRRFFIHIQRDCCQAKQNGSSQPMASEAPPPMVSEDPRSDGVPSEHKHVCQQRWWPQLRNILRTRAWPLLCLQAEICTYLSHTCVICGLWCNRFQELHGHIRLHHAHAVRGIEPKMCPAGTYFATGQPLPFVSTPIQT